MKPPKADGYSDGHNRRLCYRKRSYLKRLKSVKMRVAQEGLEPPRGCPQQILSLPCLPFHHWAVVVSPDW